MLFLKDSKAVYDDADEAFDKVDGAENTDVLSSDNVEFLPSDGISGRFDSAGGRVARRGGRGGGISS